MTAATLKIGALARRTGTNAPTIRYYEQIGLLPKALRQTGSQRVYDDQDAQRLTFIRRCRDFGFSIDKVRLLISLVQDRERSCNEARDLAHSHLLAVRDKLTELQQPVGGSLGPSRRSWASRISSIRRSTRSSSSNWVRTWAE